MRLKNINIRETDDSDLTDIMEVESQAFGYDKEAELTAALLTDETAEPVLSLLAFNENKAVGHVLFTRVYLNEIKSGPLLHILAPLAVIPDCQKQGIGGMLIVEGIKRLEEMGSKMVFVLGHMEYYPKYGFIPDAGSLGYDAPYPIPPEFSGAWMVQALSEEGLVKQTGHIICCNKLNKPEHWRE